MAIVNDYVTGTISLTSGLANFTSAGAALQSAGIRAGDEILLPAKGMVLVIASITGENAGTLVANCPAGAAGATQPMRIRFQPDGSRYTAAARALVELLANGNLASLAGLAGAGNKLPYFNGGTTFALADFTAWARSLLDDADVNAFWTTVGATSPASVAFRRGNVLGSVAQSGGVPTGALIEAGSNANGNYARFADGTQMCWAEVNTTYVNSLILTATWAFPASFSGAPFVVDVLRAGTGTVTPTLNQMGLMSTGGVSAATAAIQVRGIAGQTGFATGNNVNVAVAAIGRWF